MTDILIIRVPLNCTRDFGPKYGGLCGLLEMRVPVFDASSRNQLSCNWHEIGGECVRLNEIYYYEITII